MESPKHFQVHAAILGCMDMRTASLSLTSFQKKFVALNLTNFSNLAKPFLLK